MGVALASVRASRSYDVQLHLAKVDKRSARALWLQMCVEISVKCDFL